MFSVKVKDVIVSGSLRARDVIASAVERAAKSTYESDTDGREWEVADFTIKREYRWLAEEELRLEIEARSRDLRRGEW